MNTTHLTAAHLSRAVYLDPSDWSFHQKNAITWIAVEGSDELADWRRNLEFAITSSDEHLGFGTYARELMAQMWAAGIDLDPTRHTVLCGHSLGGAVATIIAAQLQDHIPSLELVTFGSPRPGGVRFRHRLRVPHTRYVHGHDVVPRLPSPLLGFRHTTPATVLPVIHDSALLGVVDHDMDGYRIALQERHATT
ncbi:MAG: lipase family protein [Betaproteobacteria bacterium]|jgi:pimeloyl-ACP methyl ester carboxylesterase|nr:lipase family protein [Betaproteobacteria bacterium]